MEKKIKVGLLVDSLFMPIWVQNMLELILKQQGIDIVLIVENAIPEKKSSLLGKVLSNKGTLLYSLWRIIDKRLFSVSNDAFKIVDLSTCLKAIPKISVIPEQKKFSDYFLAEDIKKIQQYDVDVFLRLGFRVLRGDILQIAKCGVWSYHHGDNRVNRGGPAGVWEVLLNKATTGSILQVLTEDLDGGKVLYRSWSATNPYSIHRNLNTFYWKTLSFIPRRLNELKQMGVDGFLKKYEKAEAEPFIYKDRLYTKPNNKTAIKLLLKLGIKIISRGVWRLHSMEQWMLLYHVGKADVLPSALFRFKHLVPPRDRFWADPCVYHYQGKQVIFIEECEYSNNKGYLSVIEFDEDNKPLLPPLKIIEKPYHLSFPFVIEDNNELYMIPESQENRSIELYQCQHFPDKWEFVMNLMEDINAVDTVIWKHKGKYWLFSNITENSGASSCDELFLFYSDSLVSDNWTAHTQNPIVSDVRCARSAGNIFMYNNQWYRPAQDCSDAYGKAIAIQRIVTIDENSYQEVSVSRIDAEWDEDIIRTHSLSQMGNLTCIDGLRKRRKI